MSGHSKWSSIKHKKAAVDAKRGKLFTKLIKEITVAARIGGGDPAGNPRLRHAIIAARAASMPNDTIDRAVKRGTGDLEGVAYVDVTYEGYGPGGMAVLLEALTDNRNRTVADVRSLFSKHGGAMGETGCVAWMFDRVGQIRTRAGGASEERVLAIAADAGATDVRAEDGAFVVVTEPDVLEAVRRALEEAGVSVHSAEVAVAPKSTVHLTGADAAKALRLLEALEDHDDVQRVSANFDIDDEELSRLSA
jgi:YebC/PmpR family DNA-binding regulatory protein